MSILIFVQPAEHKWDLHTLCLIQLLSRVELHLRRVARMLIAPASKLQPPTNQIGSTGPAHDQEQRVDNSNPEGILLFWLLQYLQEAPITQPNKSKENRNRLSRGGEEGGGRKWALRGGERLRAVTCTQQRQDVNAQNVSRDPNHLRCVYPF